MTTIQVHCELRFDVRAPSDFALALMAADTRRQHAKHPRLAITPDSQIDRTVSTRPDTT